MYKAAFGKQNKMIFGSPQEYYETLGFLAKSDGSIEIYWEHNEEQGAWGSEGRIHCISNIDKFTNPLRLKFTRGRGQKVLYRINCNDFIQDLRTNHAFDLGGIQNTPAIRLTIPAMYQADFDRGYNL